MKISKLLNSNYLLIFFVIFLVAFNAKSEDEPVDIWNVNENKTINKPNFKIRLIAFLLVLVFLVNCIYRWLKSN